MLTEATLINARKKLLARWDAASSDWDDSVSKRFEQTYLAPLDQKLRLAVGAMEKMDSVLRRIERDCG